MPRSVRPGRSPAVQPLIPAIEPMHGEVTTELKPCRGTARLTRRPRPVLLRVVPVPPRMELERGPSEASAADDVPATKLRSRGSSCSLATKSSQIRRAESDYRRRAAACSAGAVVRLQPAARYLTTGVPASIAIKPEKCVLPHLGGTGGAGQMNACIVDTQASPMNSSLLRFTKRSLMTWIVRRVADRADRRWRSASLSRLLFSIRREFKVPVSTRQSERRLHPQRCRVRLIWSMAMP